MLLHTPMPCQAAMACPPALCQKHSSIAAALQLRGLALQPRTKASLDCLLIACPPLPSPAP
jgi:hypothetical protein